MGVKHFFSWFRQNFPTTVSRWAKTEQSKTISQPIDTLLLDLNGIFHTCAAKVYEYGPHKKPQGLLKRPGRISGLNLQIRLFEEICKTIDNIADIVVPTKALVLCIDGVAPMSKQCQQRSRRFRTAAERSEEDFKKFDSNCITPGTKFLDHLSKYMDWWIQQQISSKWGHLDVVFSNEKVPGEGEHKLITYLRQNQNKEDTYCVYGVDADLIMLSLGTHLPNFFLIRENMFARGEEYFLVNIGESRTKLVERMRWTSPHHDFDEKSGIHDFIFLCFATGNDFLPHIPTIEIMEGGIETMLSAYQSTCSDHGHITEMLPGRMGFRKEALRHFFKTIAANEAKILEAKANKKECFFPDPLLDSHCMMTDKGYKLNFSTYQAEYVEEKWEGNANDACKRYLDGLLWVLNYYLFGVPNWTWLYPYHYAPFAGMIAKTLEGYTLPIYKSDKANPPFLQLLTVLPPRSSELLPAPLNTIVSDKTLEIAKYFPEEIEIDLTGRRKEWEGVTIIPFVDVDALKSLYNQRIRSVPSADAKRNQEGKTAKYSFSSTEKDLVSFYGNVKVNCIVKYY